MEHENSILYGPVNALWHSVQHAYAWNIPDHVINAFLVLLISCVVFPLASRRYSKDNPGPFQQILELVVTGIRSLIDDIIGHDGRQYLDIIGGFAVFIFVATSSAFSFSCRRRRRTRTRPSVWPSWRSSITTITASACRASAITSSISPDRSGGSIG
jgi:F0F1-type ATP synthase membrane subunit a